MGLQKYHKKRNFKTTNEPRGREGKSTDKLQFVVQEHHASTLHYDFRLEMEGVLRSWAVPKGPSTDPGTKRLAVEVEDHPLEYGKFQGVIPKGGYGAGRVIRWDRGTWEPEGDPVRAFKKGHIDFTLHGEKLRGKWLLVRTRKKQGSHSQWLLMKRTDDKTTAKKVSKRVKTLDHRDKMPARIEPQLCQLVKEAPKGSKWLHEIKFDGYRLLCRVEGSRVRLITRQGHDWTEKFSQLRDAIEAIGLKNTIIDGEIVCLNKNGLSDFSCLQETLSRSGKTKSLIFYAFDLLFLNGNDLRGRPLKERKELLAILLSNHPSKKFVKLSEHIDGQGPQFFKQCCKSGLEGMISKLAESPYTSGRSDDWVKVKCINRQEFVIGGYTDPKGSRVGLGALLLGVNEKDGLRYAGKIGTGFNTTLLADLKKKFARYEQETSPFKNHKKARGVHWLNPKLVAEVKFAGLTESKNIRQGVFEGLREDKNAKSVHLDVAKKMNDLKPQKPHLTHPEKVLFKDTGITKQDVADYYETIQDKIMPYIENRPLTLLRCPSGGKKMCFFQRHAKQIAGPEIHEIEIEEKDEKDQREPYMYIDSINGLIQLVQMGSLELHAWNAKIDDILHPDHIIFDLDPDENFPWKKVVEAAHELRKILKSLGLESFVKLSGGKGVHIEVPIKPEFEWEILKNFSHSVVKLMKERNPDLYTDNVRKDARQGKIFIDYLRNGFSSTSVVPYGIRNRPGTPVAMPISWAELTTKLKPDSFTFKKALKRLQTLKKDPWANYHKIEQSLEILKKKQN